MSRHNQWKRGLQGSEIDPPLANTFLPMLVYCGLVAVPGLQKAAGYELSKGLAIWGVGVRGSPNKNLIRFVLGWGYLIFTIIVRFTTAGLK